MEVKRMTVCVAALAAETKAIVCVADKALTYGNYIQWDSEGGKIIKLNPSGSLAMFSDEGTAPRVLTKFFERGNDIGKNKIGETIAICEEQYGLAFKELAESKFLKSRLLKPEDYQKAVTSPDVNRVISSIADEIKEFDMECYLLICGFAIDNVPFILQVVSPGIATDMGMTGHHAIGAGGSQAISRLLFSEHKREHSIERVLYDCFDAKVNAEMVISVGYEWDAVIVTRSNAFVVPPEIKEIIEKVWGKYSRSPFDKFNPKEHWATPKKWKERLEEYSKSLL
jgi:hypothetical protein